MTTDEAQAALLVAETAATKAAETTKASKADYDEARKAHTAAKAAVKKADDASKNAAVDAANAAGTAVEAAKAEWDADKEAKAKADAALKTAKTAVADAKKAEDAARPTQNGVRAPAAGTDAAAVWAAADEASKAKGGPAALTELEGVDHDLAKATYNRWKKFYGVKGRVLTAEEQSEADAKAAAKVAAKKAKATRIEQNGIKHPLPGTKCGNAWQVFDEISSATGAPAKIAAATILGEARGLNVGNVRCEYTNWRKFHAVGPQRTAPTAEDFTVLAAAFPDVAGFTEAAAAAAAKAEEEAAAAEAKAAKQAAAEAAKAAKAEEAAAAKAAKAAAAKAAKAKQEVAA